MKLRARHGSDRQAAAAAESATPRRSQSQAAHPLESAIGGTGYLLGLRTGGLRMKVRSTAASLGEWLCAGPGVCAF
jgi:hypothetical protein